MKFLKALFFPYHGDFNGYRALAIAQLAALIVVWLVYPNADLPTPIEIIHSWNNLALNQGLLPELWISIKTIWLALLISSAISLGLSYLSTAAFFKPITNFISSFRFLGFAGLTFLFTLWTSGPTELKIWLLTFGMTVFLVTNTLAEVSSITQESVDYLKTLKFSGWRITFENVVLGKADVMLDLIRQNAAIGWTLLAMVEGITRSQGGIGALLLNQNKHFDLAAIFAIQFSILLYGLLQDVILVYLRNFLCPYSTLTKSK